MTFVQNGVFLLLVLWVARRMGLRNTTAPPSVAVTDPRLVAAEALVYSRPLGLAR